MLRFVTILACLVICRSDGAATVVSVDVGGSVKLNCSANDSNAAHVRWELWSTSQKTLFTISERLPEFASRFNVTFLSEGFSQLLITDVRPSDDGQYYCLKPKAGENILIATLRVTGYQITSRVAFVGKTTHFSCESFKGSDIQWDFRSLTPSSSPVTIYNGQQVGPIFQPRFNVTLTANHISFLYISDVRLTDAGVFECLHKLTGRSRSRGSLTVLAEEPRCTTLNSHKELICRVCYAGETKPNITCQGDIEENINVSSVRELNKTCRLYAKLLTAVNLGFDLSCSVIFASQHGVDYNYTWKALQSTTDTDEIVISGPVSIHHLNRVVFQQGDKLTCVAGRSYPETKYQWLVNDKVKIGHEYNIDVCDFMSETHQLSNASNSLQIISVSVLCIARHGADLLTSKTVSINIYSKELIKNCENENSHSISLIIVGVVVAMIATAIGIALVVKLLRKRIECTCVDKKENMTDDNSHTNDTVHYAEIRDNDTDDTTTNVDAAVAEVHAPFYVNISVLVPAESFTDEIVIPKPYEDLNSASREPPRPPPVYNRLCKANRTQLVN